MWRRLVYLGACSTLVVGCHRATSGFGEPVSYSRNVLFAAEIAKTAVNTVYQAVMQLRPEFLRGEPAPAPVYSVDRRGVRVFLDNVELGDQTTLREIPLDRVTMIRYVEPGEAALRYGSAYRNGVIIVSTSTRLP